VDPTQNAMALKDRQIPANRLGGDVEGLRKGVDLDPT
jgi:hypothetical protein